MRDYGKIRTSLWFSQKWKAIGNHDRPRLLYFYLHTCSQVCSVGCFRVKIGTIAGELKWGVQQTQEALDRLSSVFLVEWNEQESLVRIVDYIRHDPPTNLKHLKGMFRVALGVPDSEQKLRVLKDLVNTKWRYYDAEIQAEISRLSIGYPESASVVVPYPLSHTRLPIEESDSADSTDRLSNGVRVNGHKPAKIRRGGPPGFDAWYAAYPRHEARTTAERAYAMARRQVSEEILLEGAVRYAKEREGQDPRYTKQPATWLNGGCWADEKPAQRDILAEVLQEHHK